ncbi:MAG: TonB-dependent receptor [Verrucomicrobiales bacterium]|nr:TonB-dependent receptor [Verrucomicrobiales bacterium]
MKRILPESLPLRLILFSSGVLFACQLAFSQGEEADTALLETTVVRSSTLEPPAPRALPRPVIVNQTTESATRTEKKVSDVPATIGIISRDEIARIAPLSFDDLIRTEPNVDTLGGPRYLGEQLMIRGQGGNAVTVRIDDARQNFASGHAGQRFFFEPDFLQEVEILKGGGSFLYGSGAAGVVNISTLDPSDLIKEGNAMGLRIRNTYHSNTSEWANSAIGAVSTEYLDLMIGTSDRSGNNITLPDDVELADSAIERESNIAKMVLRPGVDQQLTISVFDYHSLDQGAANPQGDTDSTVNPPVGRDIDYMQWVGNYQWNPAANDLIDLNATLYYNTTRQVRNYLDTTGSNVGRQNIHELDVFGIDLHNRSIVEFGGLEHELVYGLEFVSESQDGVETRDTFFAPGSIGSASNRPDAEADNLAFFLTDEIDLTDNLTLFTGLRYDTYSTSPLGGNTVGQEDGALSPHIGFDLDIGEHFSLVGQYSRAFTRPTLNDFYQSGSHYGIVPNEPFTTTVREPQGGFFLPAPFGSGVPEPGLMQFNYFEEVFIPNTDLLPETNNTFELGVHYENDDVGGGQLSAHLTGFYQRGENTFDSEIVGTSNSGGYSGFANPPGTENVPASVGSPLFPGGPSPTYFTGLNFDGNLEQVYRQTVNRAETEIYGGEFVLDYDSDQWFGSFAAGAVRGKDLDTGLALNSTTGDQLSLTLGIRPMENVEIGAYGIWNAGREDLVSDPYSQTGAYDIYGLFATWQATESWQLRVGVDNLLDQGYERTSILQEEAGRNVFVTSTLHW